MRVIALAVIHMPYRLRGEEVRFLRHYLRMNGEEFSGLLHIDKTTLSKWENDDDRIGDQSDRLVRLVALALGDGLKEQLEEVVRQFPKIQSTSRKISIRLDPRKLSYQYG
jgi:transcriptional regulator with XRE-family HTH domain